MINDEFKDLFYKKLKLATLSFEVQSKFLASITRYLSHGRKEDVINGRTYEFVNNKLDKLLNLLYAIGYNDAECVQIITNLPSLLNSVDDLYGKYLFLEIVENDENSFRRDKLLNKTKDFMVGLQKMYARYRLICESGYDKIRWNSLVHASDREFASIFVLGTYDKPYQMFSDETEVDEWLSRISLDDLDLEEVKKSPFNEELVAEYEEIEGKRRNL